MSKSTKSSKVRRRPARCKQVLVILNNRIETAKLIREEVYPPGGDFAEDVLEMAVERWHGLEVSVPLECVMFLNKLPPEPQWIQSARAKLEKELVSRFRSNVKRAIGGDHHEKRTAHRVMPRRKP